MINLNMRRDRIYTIIEKADEGDRASSIYDTVMIVLIVISLVPLAFKSDHLVFQILDKVAMIAFMIDYILRWMTADYHLDSKHAAVLYPFTPMAMIDLLSILPSLTIINKGFKVLRVLRMIRALRVIRVFKALRYSKSFVIIGNVMRKSKDSLIAVCMLAGGYILVSALVIFNVEPDSFETFFDAIYWATVSLTTVGYGDIYPVTNVGRLITMISSVLGIAVVALPASIITAGYMSELEKKNKREPK